MIKLKEVIEQHVDKMPVHLQSQVLNFVLFLEGQSSGSKNDSRVRKQKLKKAFDNLVAKNIFKDIDDPVEWVREQRRDRELPYRRELSSKKP